MRKERFMEIEILKPTDLKSYKELIDECFGTSNDLKKYQKYNELLAVLLNMRLIYSPLISNPV